MLSETTYCVFPTEWGYFGLLASNEGLSRTCLPLEDSQQLEYQLLGGVRATYSRALFSELQKEIKAYFRGNRSEFTEMPDLALNYYTNFTQAVYTALRSVCLGKTITYGDLARRSGSPNASRAVGRAMALNPLPLLIPCHRVVRSNGMLGGFSAPGGVFLKQRLLEHEKSISADY